MLVEIDITNEDVRYAERILLPAGHHFDKERQEFIKDLSTLDLQAVPGSGKTTALLAKLLILDKKLPFPDGSGILVISHTNVAVDEIKEKIGRHCVNLFRYPNFVGTIQSLIDKFLCIPYYIHQYKKKPLRIDDEIFKEYMRRNTQLNISGYSADIQKKGRHFLIANDLAKQLKVATTATGWHLSTELGGSELNYSKPPGRTKRENYRDWTQQEKQQVRSWCHSFKQKQFQSGNLSYDDAYTFAEFYVKKMPNITTILSSRFKYVFVDEMQDMAPHQYNLLEKIFFREDGTTVYQRIGDKNQAIFDGNNSFVNIWQDRALVRRLVNSHRFSPLIANVVSRFATTPITVDGRRKNPDGSDITIKPHILVYTDETKGRVIASFAELIAELKADGSLPADLKEDYSAIGWRKGIVDDEAKITIPDYHPPFTRAAVRSKIDFQCLNDYLLLPQSSEVVSLKKIREQILNGLLASLRSLGILNRNRYYTKYGLFEVVELQSKEAIELFKSNIYTWSAEIAKGNSVVDDVKAYLPTLISFFGRTVDIEADLFINTGSSAQSTSTVASLSAAGNEFEHNSIKIKVCTIHSVKGTTHTCTLYLETYIGSGRSTDVYESQRLKERIKGNVTAELRSPKAQQSAKMAYVGFSRPTHLLAFAVHRNRFESLGFTDDDESWIIRNVT